MQEIWVWSLGREDPLEEGLATHSSPRAWRIPWTEEPGGLTQSWRQLKRLSSSSSSSLYYTHRDHILFIPLSVDGLQLRNTLGFVVVVAVCLFLCRPACRILVSPLGIHPGPPAVVAQSPNHWTAWELPNIFAVFFWLALTPQWNACHMKRILRFPPPDAVRLTQTALHLYVSGEKLSPARPGFRWSGKALWRT